MSQTLEYRYAWSPLFGGNAVYVEDLYETYLDNPNSVPENWQRFVSGIAGSDGDSVSHRQLREALAAGKLPALASSQPPTRNRRRYRA